MKKLFLFILVAIAALSHSQAADYRELCGYSDSVGEWKICIEVDRLNSLPEFDPNKESPPVTIPQAIAEAKRSLGLQFPQVKKWEFSQIVFEGAQFKDLGFWQYTVRLYANPGTDSPDILEAWIAMDGRALIRKLVQKKPEPNQALLPTTTAVTPAASHPSRQP